MRKLFFLSIAAVLLSVPALAQRLGYVDSEYILKHIPEFNSAQKQLDALSTQWQKEVDTQYADIDKLYKAFQADQVLLTDEMRKRRENEIVDKENAVKAFYSQKFSPQTGDLSKEQIRLIQPIRDRVAKAVQAVADAKQLSLMFDKSTTTFLFADPSLDRSNDVITRLGYKPGAFADGSK